MTSTTSSAIPRAPIVLKADIGFRLIGEDTMLRECTTTFDMCLVQDSIVYVYDNPLNPAHIIQGSIENLNISFHQLLEELRTSVLECTSTQGYTHVEIYDADSIGSCATWNLIPDSSTPDVQWKFTLWIDDDNKPVLSRWMINDRSLLNSTTHVMVSTSTFREIIDKSISVLES